MQSQITHNTGDRYKATGVLYNSETRFKPIHSDNPSYILSINLWRGSIWQQKGGNGPWKRIKQVYN